MLAEATKNAKIKYNQWRNAGKPKGRENPLKSQLMVAKGLLKKAQRQAYASQRECLARNIMTASSSDTKLFHYLLRRQRSVDIQHTRILQYNDQVAETNEDILALWQKYFQYLSNPDFKQDFDYEKYDLSHIQNAIIEKNEKGKLKIEPIKEEEIERAIKNLKPGKSPDIDGISAEHYKNAMDELKPLILHILNTIIEELDIPQMLKRGTMTPVLKKNKDRQNPPNYRGITNKNLHKNYPKHT